MAMEMPKYRCSHNTLYIVCEDGWENCLEYLADFARYKRKYNAQLVGDAIAAVRAAEDLMSPETCIMERSIQRGKLEGLAKKVRENYQALKGYVTSAYEASEVHAMLEEAGASVYRKATHDNWSAVRRLARMGKLFIVNHEAALLADDNMPADFAATYAADGDACIAGCRTYFSLNRAVKPATAKKVEANNKIYESLNEMFMDGQLVMRNKVQKQFFTWRQAVKNVDGVGVAGFKGLITDAVTGLPLANAKVATKNARYVAVSDVHGRYAQNRMQHGEWTFIVTMEGYKSIEITVTINAGVKKHMNFVMERLTMDN